MAQTKVGNAQCSAPLTFEDCRAANLFATVEALEEVEPESAEQWF